MHKVLLETERLILRQFTKMDTEHIFELDNDPQVMRYINGGTPTERKIIQREILPVFLQYDHRYPASSFWAAVEKDTGDFLGWFSFRPTGSYPTEVTLGFRLRRAAWGKGYATEGARALIAKGFDELGVQRVVATTYEENLTSQRVMQKIGMQFERMFRITVQDILKSDTYHAAATEIWEGYDVEYAIEKSAWERSEIV